MNFVYFFTEDRKSYCEGSPEDRDKHYPNSIEVSKRPGEGYWYNFEKNEWEKDASQIKAIWEPERAKLLKNTFWLLEAIDSPLSVSQKTELETFRSQLVALLEGDITTKEFQNSRIFEGMDLMKRIFEGATVITAIFMLLSVAGFFIFSVQNKSDKIEERKRTEKVIEETKADYDRKIHQKEKEMEALKMEYDAFYEEIRPIYPYTY